MKNIQIYLVYILQFKSDHTELRCGSAMSMLGTVTQLTGSNKEAHRHRPWRCVSGGDPCHGFFKNCGANLYDFLLIKWISPQRDVSGWVVDTFFFGWLPRRLVSFFLFWVKERYLRYHPSGFVIRKTMEFYYYGGIRDGIWNCPPEQVGLESLGHSGIQTARIIGTCQASPGPARIHRFFSPKIGWWSQFVAI